MPVITLFSGVLCRKEVVVKELISHTGFKLLTDKEIIAGAAELSGMSWDKIERAFSAKPSVFNKFTHEKERSIAYLKLSLANALGDDNLIIAGFSGLLAPKTINHVLRVCLIADLKFRVEVAAQDSGLSQKEATRQIHKNDEDRAAWINALFRKNDPWDADLYDIVIPMDKTSVQDATALIREYAGKEVVRVTNSSKKAASDFLLAARTETALAQEGHDVEVSAAGGVVTLIINKKVLMLSRLEEELKSIASKVDGVKSVETKVGKDFYQADIYRRFDFEVPSRVLLVDDEREFVQTLSERLLLRDMGSAVAYDGESALTMVKEDEPEVMILDLKMPGIDGIEVLRRVKQTNPDIEVIILTGHGSEKDKEVCMQLGAFGYMQKPVDIDLLSETLKKANEKIRLKKAKKN
jgi:two-component system, OmpR family, response regulator CpxR